MFLTIQLNLATDKAPFLKYITEIVTRGVLAKPNSCMLGPKRSIKKDIENYDNATSFYNSILIGYNCKILKILSTAKNANLLNCLSIFIF